MVIPLWSWWQRLVWGTRGPWLYGRALYHYYSMSCQRYTDAVMIMTVKKLSCWFNSGWSHLQSVGEDVSLKSMCFLRSRGFVNERLGGAEELWAENWLQSTSTLVDRVSAQSDVCECTHKFRLYSISPTMSWPARRGASATTLTVRCDRRLSFYFAHSPWIYSVGLMFCNTISCFKVVSCSSTFSSRQSMKWFFLPVILFKGRMSTLL